MENKNQEQAKRKALVIVDMVNGFINEGILHDPHIDTITDEIVRLAEAYIENGDKVIAFKDCHTEASPELISAGGVMPPHCMKGTSEVDQVSKLAEIEKNMEVFEKNSTDGFMVPAVQQAIQDFDELAVVGCCTDICVKNFAISAKNFFNQNNKQVIIKVPENAVETYHNPALDHDRGEWNQMAFRFMRQAGVEIVKSLEIFKRINFEKGLSKTQTIPPTEGGKATS